MNEMTMPNREPDRRVDGRATAGTKGVAYDVTPYLAAWDPSAMFTDGDARALLEVAA